MRCCNWNACMRCSHGLRGKGERAGWLDLDALEGSAGMLSEPDVTPRQASMTAPQREKAPCSAAARGPQHRRSMLPWTPTRRRNMRRQQPKTAVAGASMDRHRDDCDACIAKERGGVVLAAAGSSPRGTACGAGRARGMGRMHRLPWERSRGKRAKPLARSPRTPLAPRLRPLASLAWVQAKCPRSCCHAGCTGTRGARWQRQSGQRPARRLLRRSRRAEEETNTKASCSPPRRML